MDVLILFLGIAGIILLSSFFSAAETAITAVNEAKIHQLKSQGNKRAEAVYRLRLDKEKLIGSILLANNGLNILASSIVATYMVSVIGDEGVIYASFLMTIIILIFAEVLPKSYAFEYPEKLSLAIAPIIGGLVVVCSPLTSAIQWIVSKILKIIIGKKEADLVSGTEVIRGAIELSLHQGAMVKQERDMLGGVLDLGEVAVEQIMRHRSKIISISIDQDIDELIKTAINSPHSRLPIWEKDPDNIIGILHIKSLFRLVSTNKVVTKELIKENLAEPWFIPNTTPLKDQLQNFRNKRNHFALVIDEYGVLMGLVTLEDILEEIVGEIDDEHDTKGDEVIKVADNIYIAEATTNIRDINRELDLKLNDEDANTIGGLIIYHLERIPEIKEEIVIENVKFKILKMEEKKIKTIEIELLS
ncbi:HlyC/CorC family transporter [Rickettsiales endosymbiont of Stachyamoeba lipophora]|uniref:HlyC/CorC family transporter n=1 Tax=Rickettsiales endosymbiont of Stachyamoeba lipophora TaxID=2486578 RepID=UPI000F651410|nr:CNNM domain-containing protein [Rickettsiales endosymbiont of Stachyamoeba lipophora]AZL15833.1 DUF21 domain-containing protein [Rickettsiales endosymbiont of Stachyamoeba lipophora]